MIEIPAHGVDRMADLVAVRHGQSEANVLFAAAISAGHSDVKIPGPDSGVPLSELGRRQAQQVGTYLATLPAHARPQAVVCSPYLRARQTLEEAGATADGLRVVLELAQYDERLVDRRMGEWELLLPAQLRHRFPGAAAEIQAQGEFLHRPPGGESFADVAARLASFLEDAHRTYRGQRVLLIAHDAVVLMLRRLIEGFTWRELASISQSNSVANGSITHWSWRVTPNLVAYNVKDHVADLNGGSA
ncbi:histidine phosphatase family protein [Nonomuraea sp. NPDC050310]|uniref:histidine phosphatase family protein n=1 Tax=Nonomuraea sp. NPDC050310 TaxID=3154935 RepID=UPI0033C2889E